MCGNFIKDFFGIDIETIEIDGKKWYKGTDIARELKVTSIRALIQNYDEEEKKVINTVKETGNQVTIYISKIGVYRLLYNVKGEYGVRFRRKVNEILEKNVESERSESSESDNSMYSFLD